MSSKWTDEHSTTGMTHVGQRSTRMIVSMTACNSVLVIPYPHFFTANITDTNDALHFYSNSNVKTMNGVLNITTERKTNLYKAFNEKTKKFYADKKYIQSGMVQSWNKFCITGGIIEFKAKLPGDPSVGGLWPARESVFVVCVRANEARYSLFEFVVLPYSVVVGKPCSCYVCRIVQLHVAIQL
jgi:beta-glucanase (GH16 family)